MIISLLKFNPYPNRQVKGYNSYVNYSPYIQYTYTNINFNPNDGVDTEIILNTESDGCDYAILTDDSYTIISRWFIIDGERTRLGQYRYKLRRDVVYDHLNEILLSTAYIRKGWCNTNNSSIYNQEDLAVNQIKQSEYLLKDKTETPWIVGYMTGPDSETEVSWDDTYVPITISEATFDILSSEDPLYSETPTDLVFEMTQMSPVSLGVYPLIKYNYNGSINVLQTNSNQGATWRTQLDTHGFVYTNDCFRVGDDVGKSLDTDTFKTTINAEIAARYEKTIENYYDDYNNKIVNYNGTDYRVTFSSYTTSGTYTPPTTSSARGIIASAVADHNRVSVKPAGPSGVPVTVNYQIKYYIPHMTETVNKYTTRIPADEDMLKLNTQPYAMFAIPYFDFQSVDIEHGTLPLSGVAGMAIAQGISAQFSGAGQLLDLQLLPYCPLQDYIVTVDGKPTMNLDAMPVGSYTPIHHVKGGTPFIESYIFWCTKDSFTFSIVRSIDVSNNPITFKTMNQTLSYRICSPNYSGAFDFSPTRNNGISWFNVDCTYKPYNPYIHINPNFKGLYGSDYNDSRGLICGGDFSLPQVIDQWKTFEIQNKNYANSFNREVQSIELQNRYAKTQDVIKAVTGSFTGAAAGAAGGNFVGGGGAGAAGAIIGAGASAAGGYADVQINQRLREEQLDLKKDLYNYSIQNIQALPMTLSKVGALNANNKLFPFIEVYGCLEDETLAVQNKFLYNGFTINKIGRIIDYTTDQVVKDLYGFSDWFLQCDLIRTDIHEDWHMIRTIKDELEMGVFI